jgi:GNAT superfamily N-acetyltransferase
MIVDTSPRIRELRADADIAAAYPLMAMLRDRVRPETFVDEVRHQQTQGYQLIGCFDGARLTALAGVRRTHTLSRGEHLFVDDLVTDEAVRGRGHGRALLHWLAQRCLAEGVQRIYLDSRNTAVTFYERMGFQFLSSVPCYLELHESTAHLREPADDRSASGTS